MTNSMTIADQYNQLIKHLTNDKHLTKTYKRENLKRTAGNIAGCRILNEDHRADLLGQVKHAIAQVG